MSFDLDAQKLVRFLELFSQLKILLQQFVDLDVTVDIKDFGTRDLNELFHHFTLGHLPELQLPRLSLEDTELLD